MRSLILLLLLSSCASNKEVIKFDRLLSQKKCEEATHNIPQFDVKDVKTQASYVAGSATSYVLTGAAYGIDVVYFVTAGIVVPVAVCSPIIIGEGVVKGPGEHSAKCLEGAFDATQKYDSIGMAHKFGKKVYKDTANLRCKNDDHSVEVLIRIADCYSDRNDNEKALAQLNKLLEPYAYGGCISEPYIKEIENKIQKISSVKN